MLYAIVSAYASMPKHWWCSTVDLCTLQELWWIMKSSCKYSGWSGRRGTSNGSQNFKHVVLAFWIFWQLPRWSKVAKCGQMWPRYSSHWLPCTGQPLSPHLTCKFQANGFAQKITETKLNVCGLWTSMGLYGHLWTSGVIWSYLIRGTLDSRTLPAFDWKKWETLPRTWRQASRHLDTSQDHEPASVTNSFIRNPQAPGHNRSWVEHKTKAHTNP